MAAVIAFYWFRAEHIALGLAGGFFATIGALGLAGQMSIPVSCQHRPYGRSAGSPAAAATRQAAATRHGAAPAAPLEGDSGGSSDPAVAAILAVAARRISRTLASSDGQWLRDERPRPMGLTQNDRKSI